MDPSAIISIFGPAGVIIVLCLIVIRVQHGENKELRQQMRDDQAQILPALTEATQTMADFARFAAVLLDRHERE